MAALLARMSADSTALGEAVVADGRCAPDPPHATRGSKKDSTEMPAYTGNFSKEKLLL